MNTTLAPGISVVYVGRIMEGTSFKYYEYVPSYGRMDEIAISKTHDLGTKMKTRICKHEYD